MLIVCIAFIFEFCIGFLKSVFAIGRAPAGRAVRSIFALLSPAKDAAAIAHASVWPQLEVKFPNEKSYKSAILL